MLCCVTWTDLLPPSDYHGEATTQEVFAIFSFYILLYLIVLFTLVCYLSGIVILE